MAKANLNVSSSTIVFGNDNVVIQKFNGGLKGGRALDVTGVTDTYLYAGHVIITDGDGTYKPLPYTTNTEGGVTSKAYEALPSGFSYAGILYTSIAVSNPSASIMIDGEVNEAALPIPLTSELKSAIKAELPKISFIKDEAA